MSHRNVLYQRAVERSRKGYNCAQSVLLTMFEHWNGKNKLIPKIATAFGGGIGRCGSVCGALTGGVMAIGIKYGTNEPLPDERLKAYELARTAYKEFEKRHGNVLCRKLIGYDLSNPEEFENARRANVFEEKCRDFIGTAVEIIASLSES